MTSLWLLQVNFVGSLEWIHQLSGALPVIRNVFTDNFFYNLYKILSALQDWQNFAKIATFAKFAVFSNLPTFRGRSTWVNLFALIISPTTFAIGKILLKSPLSKNSPFSPTLWGPFNWLYLFPLIISSTTLAKFRQNRDFVNFAVFANFANISDPSSWVNLFALIISSTNLAKFWQNRHFYQIRRFRQIRQHFGALLAGLIY